MATRTRRRTNAPRRKAPVSGEGRVKRRAEPVPVMPPDPGTSAGREEEAEERHGEMIDEWAEQDQDMEPEAEEEPAES